MSLVHTIGHSSHSQETFTGLLLGHGIEVVVDTRSLPYSKYTPQFDRESVQKALAQSSIKYLFLGKELGGRPKSEDYYDAAGKVLYGKLTGDPLFLKGIGRLERGISQFRVALMCSEEDPANCHRRLLVGRVLTERGHVLLHIRADGHTEDESSIEKSSKKPLIAKQPALFAELEQDQWKSTASVSPKKAPASSST